MENQAYISHVHLKGYKSIRDMSVDLLPGLNIIIGPNGSGKTNFLEFLEISMTTHKLNQIRQEFSAQIEAIDSQERVNWYLKGITKVLSSKKMSQFIVHEIVKMNNNAVVRDREVIFTNGQDIPEIKVNSPFLYPQNPFSSEESIIKTVKYLRFANPLNLLLNQGIKLEAIYSIDIIDEDGKDVEKPYYFPNIKEPLNLDGVGILIDRSFNGIYNELVSLKERLKMNQEFKTILSRFTNIKDFDFELEIVRIYNSTNLDNLFFKFFVNNKWLSWNELSDGTKRLFYILVNVFFADSREDIAVFVEEPELGIHPDQLYLLMDFLKEQSKQKQIIITTHSPEVMNILNKDELNRILVTRYDTETGTQMHKLSPQQIKKGQLYMKKVGHLSDYWVHSNLEEYEVEEEN